MQRDTSVTPPKQKNPSAGTDGFSKIKDEHPCLNARTLTNAISVIYQGVSHIDTVMMTAKQINDRREAKDHDFFDNAPREEWLRYYKNAWPYVEAQFVYYFRAKFEDFFGFDVEEFNTAMFDIAEQLAGDIEFENGFPATIYPEQLEIQDGSNGGGEQ